MSNGMIKGNNSWTSSVSSDKNLRTELEVLQREVADMKNIHMAMKN